MTTIYDVAKEAGVSITTVSRVLNNPQLVKEATRERVMQAMEKLNYIPNPSARSLNLRVHHIIALVVPDISNPFYSEVARGVQDVGDDVGTSVLLASSDGRAEKEHDIVRRLMCQQIDGVIFVRYLMDETSLHRLRDAGLPSVVIGRAPKDWTYDVVGTFGTFEALREITAGLVTMGYGRFAHAAGPPNTVIGSLRRHHYQQLLSMFDLACLDDYVAEADLTREGGREAARRLLHLPERPDVIFCANDMMAIGVLEVAHDLGIDIPGDVAVFGCDDIDVADVLRPSLTTVRIPQRDIGRKSVALLLDRVADADRPMQKLSLQAHPVFRQSTRSDHV